MIIREKFSSKEWNRLFSKYSNLGYESDENPYPDSEIEEKSRHKIELEQLDLQIVNNYTPSASANLKDSFSVIEPFTDA